MSRERAHARGALGAMLVIGSLLAALVVGAAPASADGSAGSTAPGTGANEGIAYPGNPQAEAALVAAEDTRLTEVRTVDSLASWSKNPLNSPYRIASGSAYTLVLTARTEPYTIQDLLQLEPQTFVRRPDGSYLLSEHIVIAPGATLNLATPGGLKLLLASDSDGFVSIVNYGGRLNIAGTDGAPVTISSFDRTSNRPDTKTDDGRAYIRSIGGQISLSHVVISDLGFWSGRTGGVALTGTDRPVAGVLGGTDQKLKVGPIHSNSPSVDGNKNSPLGQVLPPGDLPVPTVGVGAPQYSYVSAAISDVTVTGNAFGMFVSGANGLDIRSSSFAHSLVSGLVLHRFVQNAVVESTAAEDNAQDGIMLARATTGIVLTQVKADNNARNGVTISGLPLATGPSATGTSVGSYGNNAISNSEASGNGRYGFEVVGGTNVSVLADEAAGNETGIVVRDTARDINVVGNKVTDSASQGIALRDGVTKATVSGNIVTGGGTSMYLRDVVADVEHNTLTGANRHAVSLVGDIGDTTVRENTISGRGPSAIDAKRANVSTHGWSNDTSGWNDTTPFLVTLKRFAQPLTLIWITLGALLLFTAVHGARARKNKRHPYYDKAPVTDGRPVRAPHDLVPRQREEAGV